MKSKYIITIEYKETTEYFLKFDDGYEDYPSAGDIIDHYEEDPTYIVHEVSYTDSGAMEFLDTLADFETYREARAYVLELEDRERNKQ